jgi:oxygen-independent coproporphyrinogen-3 oxidase
MIYSESMVPYSIYFHIPFCVHRCSYCDFNTYAGLGGLIPDYVRALCREVELLADAAEERLPVHTVFFGGGTPSLLPLEGVEQILNTLGKWFDLLPDLEVTLEANPGTLSNDYLRGLRNLGVNRLSLGMQSASVDELRLLERQHDIPDVIWAITWARQAGFDNLNLDLIFGLPNQSLARWLCTLDYALSLAPEHLSLYALTLEHGTPMEKWVARGLLEQPDPDLAADMYEEASGRLAQAGFMQYEISNWAKQRDNGELMTCRHNMQYWRGQPYLGLGAGAHGYAEGMRVANDPDPAIYVNRLLNHPVSPMTFPLSPVTLEYQRIERTAEMGETMMMGLRLTQEGVSGRHFLERFGESLQEVYGKEIERLISLDLLEWAGEGGDTLRLTSRGRLLGNQVFLEFIQVE